MVKKNKKIGYDLPIITDLHDMRKRKTKNPIWRITQKERFKIESEGYPCVARTYRVKTRKISNIRDMPSEIKEIHDAYLERRKYIYKRYNYMQIEILKQHNIPIMPYQYEIRLNQYTGIG